MVQTRAEAAVLVVQLQRSALTQGFSLFGIAALAALSFMLALVALIAVALPAPWNAIVLGVLAAASLGGAIYAATSAGRSLKRDAGVIADYARGLKLDLAMINLALKDPDTDDEEKLAARERAKVAVEEAAAAKAETESPEFAPARAATAGPGLADEEGGAYASSSGSAMPEGATEREMPEPAVTMPESMGAPAPKEQSHGSA
jgi:hypothetical protein